LSNPITAGPAAVAAIAAGAALMIAGAAASSAAQNFGGNVAGQGSQAQTFTSGTVLETAQLRGEPQWEVMERNGDLMARIEYGQKNKGRG